MTVSSKLAVSGAYGIRVLRRHLLARRAVLLRELQEHVHTAREGAAPDPGDDAPMLSELHDVALAEAGRDARELEAIDAALTRMDSGVYGLCSSCGEPVGHPRLAANPHAARCIACETVHEHTAGSAA